MEDALTKAKEKAADFGFTSSVFLNVAGPYHCPFMKPASDSLDLTGYQFGSFKTPVISNVTALPMTDVKGNILAQIYSPVLWRQSIDYMISKDVTRFIEVGHGQTLTKMLKREGLDAMHLLDILA